MDEVLVSIVIPVYNVERFLAECVDSAYSQTYPNIEIILVDDGSTDNSGALCDQLASDRGQITVIHQKNGGLSAARNAGLEKAVGKYIYFLDSDDGILPDTIRTLVTEAEHYHADMVFFDALTVDEDGSEVKDQRFQRFQNYVKPKPALEMYTTMLQYRDYYTCVPMILIRREYLQDLRFMPGILHEDVLFTFELCLKNGIAVHCPVPMYLRRMRGNSIMTTRIRPRNLSSMCAIAGELLSRQCELTQEAEVIAFQKQMQVIYEVLVEFHCALSLKEKRQVRDEYRDTLHRMEKQGFGAHKQLKIARCYARRAAGKYKDSISEQIDKLRKKRTVKNSREYLRGIRPAEGPRIFLLGTPVHGNLGDHLIAAAEQQIFHEQLPDCQVVEIPTPVYVDCRKKLKKMVSPGDLIVISGGGWMGSLWLRDEQNVRNMVCDFPKNRILIFPQTVFYEDNEQGRKILEQSRAVFSRHSDLWLFLREKASYELARRENLIGDPERCILAPDMALNYSGDFSAPAQRSGALVCFRKDREKVLDFQTQQSIREKLWKCGLDTADTTTVYLYGISLKDREAALREKLEEYASAELVVTDRLHSMVFAALAGTPCIAFDNKTGKVSGVYQWMRQLPYIRVAAPEEDLDSCISQMLHRNSVSGYEMNSSEYDPLSAVLQSSVGQQRRTYGPF